VLGFSIYNPDKTQICEFSKNELQLYANATYMCDALKAVLLMMFAIAQLDMAVFGVFISEVTSFFTIRLLLNEKEFVKANKPPELKKCKGKGLPLLAGLALPIPGLHSSSNPLQRP
jgi:hypothetical protein